VSAETAFAAAAVAAGAAAAGTADAGFGTGVVAGGLAGVTAGVADLVCPQATVAMRRPAERMEILITFRIAGATMASDGPSLIWTSSYIS